MNTDQKSIETVFLITICRQLGDKCQSKPLFLTIFYLRLSIVLTYSIAAYPVCYGKKRAVCAVYQYNKPCDSPPWVRHFCNLYL